MEAEETHSKLPLLAFWTLFAGLFIFTVLRDEFFGEDAEVWRSVPTPEDQTPVVEGWRGPGELEAGGLGLVLAPLHSEADRQAYDAQVLEERFGLGPGEPLRLEVQRRESSDAASDGAFAALIAAAKSGELQLQGPDGPLGGLLFDLVAVDTAGVTPVLSVFDPESTFRDDQGSSGRFVLWANGSADLMRLTGPGFDLELSSASLNPNELSMFVASR